MKLISLKILSLIIYFVSICNGIIAGEPPFLKLEENKWGDSIFASLTMEEKIAQLIMVTAYPEQGEVHKKQLIEIIKVHKPGGIIMMQGGVKQTAKFINDLQAASETPLLIALDGETGLGFRLDSVLNYPNAQALGAIQNTSLLYQMGKDIGSQFKAMGIHINFAPVCDINTNPKNPVINFRSFGEDKINVTEKAWQISKGMQDENVLPVLKHFPGHGDTSTDSHHTLPILNHSIERLENIELYPFKTLIDSGVGGIMTAHLHIKAFDSISTPSSLSKNVVKNYLIDSLGFKGFIVTDALNMKGVAKPNAALQALIAGNDMVEFVPNIGKSIKSIKEGLNKSLISEEEINHKCKKIFAIKKWAKLDTYSPTDLTKLPEKNSTLHYNVTQRILISNSLTILRNKNSLPIENLDTLKLATVSIGEESITEFQKMVSKYKEATHFTIGKNATDTEIADLLTKLKPYNLIIGSIHGINKYPSRKYGISSSQINVVSKITSSQKVVFAFFGNAYALKHFKDIENASALVLAYQDGTLIQNLTAQLIFGAFGTDSKLPVNVDKRFLLNSGIDTKKNKSFQFGIPEEVGINSLLLNQSVDSIAMLGIDSAAYPGCQVLIAKNGKVIFHKCYGFFTYQNKQKVLPNNIYDWASVTKITGPLPALMKLYDENKFHLDVPFSNYWKPFKETDKKFIKVRDILAHQGRLEAWLPFWQSNAKENGKLDTRTFKKRPTRKYSVRVSSKLYMKKKYQAKMFEEINLSKLSKINDYKYSGLVFYLFPTIIENLTGEKYFSFVKKNFYAPLGASTITFNAYKYFPLERIIPTELDDFFRNELMQGFVHDEGAAMMGGISGNAGLFGTTLDLAKVMLMYLQYGYYGGRQYLSEGTVKEFTRIQFPDNENRRGLGFDKPFIDNHENKLEDAFPAVSTSPKSFGHSGYTGTFTWADPENQLLLVFMSNRVHPTRRNTKIYDINIRTAIHQAIYDSFEMDKNQVLKNVK